MEDRIEVKIMPDPKKVAKAAARLIKRLTTEGGQKEFHIALSGGTTPALLYKRLAKKFQDQIPWQKLHFWWGDERMVDADSTESNYRMARQTLLSKIPADNSQIHPLNGGTDDNALESERYAAEIAGKLPNKNQLPCFDLILLGLGEDGHTASIFPGDLHLFESDEICSVVKHPESGQQRITLNGKIINNAKNIFILVTGVSKAQVVSDIMNNREEALKFPAYHVIPEHGKLVWIIDSDASARI